jgi:transcription elongation GreA/GreB family factor
MGYLKIKKDLLAHCRTSILERIKHIELAIEASRQTAGNETKSSSGDKYETTRAMMHLEIEKLSAQLYEAREDLRRVDQITLRDTTTVQPGSLVYTSHAVFFISLSAGKVSLDGKDYMLISSLTPVGRALKGKTSGDSVEVNSRSFTILEIH